MAAYLPIFRSHGRAACEERSLVLEAVSLRSRIARDRDGGWLLLVHPADARGAAVQLDRYEQERARGEPPMRATPRRQSGGIAGALLYAITLIAVHLFRQGILTDADWLARGESDGALVRAGQQWRCVTSLTLHLDDAHLAGNVVFGALFGILLAHQIGSGATWLLMLVAGALGNLANDYVQPPTHRSLGASTAVFAAIGALATLEFLRRTRAPRLYLRIAPLVIGSVLLGFLGGGERTDVLAHVLGTLAGAILAAIATLIARTIPFERWPSRTLGVLALAIIAACWVLALAA